MSRWEIYNGYGYKKDKKFHYEVYYKKGEITAFEVDKQGASKNIVSCKNEDEFIDLLGDFTDIVGLSSILLELKNKNQEANILSKDKIYHLASDEVIMMSLVGGTVETVREDGWCLYKGKQAPMKKAKKLTEKEAVGMIVKKYQEACDSKGFDYEINSADDVNTHNEIEHMLDFIIENMEL